MRITILFSRFLMGSYLVATLLACKTAEPIPVFCGISADDPNQFPWLAKQIERQLIHNVDTCSIRVLEFDGKTYFHVTNLPLNLGLGNDTRFQLFDCEGIEYTQFYFGDFFTNFFKKATFKRELWRKGPTQFAPTTTNCGVPTASLPWIQQTTSFFQGLSNPTAIYQYEYQGNTVFFPVRTKGTLGIPDWAVVTCNGRSLSRTTTWDQNDFWKNARLVGMVFEKK
jgi:hypothetical protein